MDRNILKAKRRYRRKKRIRKRVSGTAQCPRLSVYRSHKNIYAQLIDDLAGRTVCEANTRNVKLRDSVGYGGNCKAAERVGKQIAEQAKEKGIERVVFDRNGYQCQGRLKALAEAARAVGLRF